MSRLDSTTRLFALAALAAALGGCAGGQGDLDQWIAQEKAKKGAPLDPLPVIKTFETFEYKAQDQRDPFGASRQEQEELAAADTGPRPDQNRPKEELERYPLDGLKMMGTLGSGATMEGLVKDPDGIIHRVRPGSYLGQNYGRITAMSEGQIDLVELVPNGVGGWMERQASMALTDTK
ncbi:pilus assembly protein PilP [Dokdonella koreensis]|uniref:Type IV pilus biogenesis protein PilP n=1 Tax=Dokdonella koreensis DS-123 TaxID=1300342 RepID=A0A160DVE2_9GAMM|nr:pilus assembly protein PilP [Dokdonella koreensis]ANB18130.1 Type IV pilus biogenesis protein PilP [Dokdonella koreensis DS-123]